MQVGRLVGGSCMQSRTSGVVSETRSLYTARNASHHRLLSLLSQHCG